jgi:hypothetical protein
MNGLKNFYGCLGVGRTFHINFDGAAKRPGPCRDLLGQRKTQRAVQVQPELGQLDGDIAVQAGALEGFERGYVAVPALPCLLGGGDVFPVGFRLTRPGNAIRAGADSLLRSRRRIAARPRRVPCRAMASLTARGQPEGQFAAMWSCPSLRQPPSYVTCLGSLCAVRWIECNKFPSSTLPLGYHGVELPVGRIWRIV